MRIINQKSVIQLGSAETRTWESGESESYSLRSFVQRRARAMLARDPRHHSVEVYAAARAGHWLADVIERQP